MQFLALRVTLKFINLDFELVYVKSVFRFFFYGVNYVRRSQLVHVLHFIYTELHMTPSNDSRLYAEAVNWLRNEATSICSLYQYLLIFQSSVSGNLRTHAFIVVDPAFCVGTPRASGL
jgi:hypothetical protein